MSAQTFSDIFKERMMDMPKELNTKKEIDEYSKKITKEIKEEAKNNKVEKAEKKKKKNNQDKDGNEKPKKAHAKNPQYMKRALTKYQKYIRDNQQRIRDEFPELSNTERFSKLAEQWKAYKATLEDAGDAGETGEAAEAAEAEDTDDANEAS